MEIVGNRICGKWKLWKMEIVPMITYSKALCPRPKLTQHNPSQIGLLSLFLSQITQYKLWTAFAKQNLAPILIAMIKTNPT